MWVRLDDDFSEHPKLRALGPLALVLQIRALCYAARHLTDGRIPHRVAWDSATDFALLCPEDYPNPATDWFVTPADMVKGGVWEQPDGEDGDYLIHDYLEYNPSFRGACSRG